MIDTPCSPTFGETIQDYDVYGLIGKGGFATVFKGRCKNTGKDVAIKKIAIRSLTTAKLVDRVQEEVKIHSTLCHEFILKLYTFFKDDDFVYLILEFCPNGNLDQKLKKLGKPFNETEAAGYLGQILDGVVYLHSRRILHRDLNPRNVLLDINEKIKIADFGLATRFESPEERHMTFCGTPNYISPEMKNKQSYDLGADVWSIGCILHTMLLGRPPDINEKYMVPGHLTTNAKDILRKCMEETVEERIKSYDLMPHPFLASYVRGTGAISCRSDSGVYTQSTNAGSMQRPKTSLSAVCEESEGVYSQDSARSNRIRRPSHSPPVKLAANSHEKYAIRDNFVDSVKKLHTNRNGIISNPPVIPYVNNHCQYKPEASSENEAFYRVDPLLVNGRNYPEGPVGIDRSSGNYIEHTVKENFNRYNPRELLPSRVKPHVRNTQEHDRRSAPVNGEIGSVEHGQMYPKQSNSLDRQRYEEERYKDRRAQTNSSGQKYSTCSSCHMEKDSNHQSRREKHFNTPSSPSAKSTKSTGSGRSRSVEILKDIAVIPKSPSPPLVLTPHLPRHTPSHPSSPHHHPLQHPPFHHQSSPHHPRNTSSPHPYSPSHPNPSPPHYHQLNIQNQNSNVFSSNCTKKSLQDLCPPLSIKKLKSIRYHCENVVLTIIEGREVCAEFLNKKNRKYIDTLCRISEDGNEITVYHPKRATPLLDEPVTIPPGDAYLYNYDKLPQKYWKKYAYAERFVKMIRKRTVKFSFPSDQAKCYLMENSPNPDFKAVFLTGQTLLFSDGKLHVNVKDSNGETNTSYDLSSENTSRDKNFQAIFHLYQHALKIRKVVEMIDQSLTEIETLTNISCFNINKKLIGLSSPSASSERQRLQHNGNDKENISPISAQSTSSRATSIARHMGPYESLAVSNASINSKQRKPLTPCQQSNINNIKNVCYEHKEDFGTFYKDERKFQLVFWDGTSLECEENDPSLWIYTDREGMEVKYDKNYIPEKLVNKKDYFKAVMNRFNPMVLSSSTRGRNVYCKPVISGRSSQLPKHIR